MRRKPCSAAAGSHQKRRSCADQFPSCCRRHNQPRTSCSSMRPCRSHRIRLWHHAGRTVGRPPQVTGCHTDTHSHTCANDRARAQNTHLRHRARLSAGGTSGEGVLSVNPLLDRAQRRLRRAARSEVVRRRKHQRQLRLGQSYRVLGYGADSRFATGSYAAPCITGMGSLHMAAN
jgi:hypothetical protein